MREIISVKNLYKLYRVGDSVVRALDGVSFSVYEGEFCAIVGTSGSGKSTLLNMLAGLEKPTRGEALENVALPLTFRGEPRKERIKKADRMLDLVSLEKHKKHLPNQLSGGQQQRVSVARALVNDPKIIFADEPTGALDSHTSQDVMRLMQRLVREQKRTLVMVTHDRSQAEYADRVLEIIDGKIVHITENRRKEENERA